MEPSYSGGNGLYQITHTGNLVTLFSLLLVYSYTDEEITPLFQCGLVDLINVRSKVIQMNIAITGN